MTRAEKKALIEALHEIWNTGRVDLIPQVYASNFVAHFPKGWGENEPRDGHAGIRATIERLRAGFPDWHEQIQDVVIDGDKVAVRYHSSGTNSGSFGGRPATGRKVSVDELSIFRIANGRVAEQWCLVDDLMFGKQLSGKATAG
jgi:predicted ester cyclase